MPKSILSRILKLLAPNTDHFKKMVQHQRLADMYEHAGLKAEAAHHHTQANNHADALNASRKAVL